MKAEAQADRPAGASRIRAFWTLIVVALLTPAISRPATDSGAREAAPLAAGAGRIHGTVTLGKQLNSRKVRFSLYPDVSGARSAPSADSREEFRNVVLYLEGDVPPVKAHAAAGDLRMEQREESFVPHVLPVLRGSAVEFPNADPIFHNVFSLSRSATFDLGRYPRGESRTVRFDTPGIVRVFCHIHSDMSAVILVLENPYFAIPDSSGSYEIPGIPPGAYTLTAWHERAHPIRREVAVTSGEPARIDFAIPLQDAPVE